MDHRHRRVLVDAHTQGLPVAVDVDELCGLDAVLLVAQTPDGPLEPLPRRQPRHCHHEQQQTHDSTAGRARPPRPVEGDGDRGAQHCQDFGGQRGAKVGSRTPCAFLHR
ncbi:hypothetical protein [Mycolicibacterium arabiense]|nr:hypothetical protein [Mycolicibacterium arabiense]